jgi:hypothetical protein
MDYSEKNSEPKLDFDSVVFFDFKKYITKEFGVIYGRMQDPMYVMAGLYPRLMMLSQMVYRSIHGSTSSMALVQIRSTEQDHFDKVENAIMGISNHHRFSEDNHEIWDDPRLHANAFQDRYTNLESSCEMCFVRLSNQITSVNYSLRDKF